MNVLASAYCCSPLEGSEHYSGRQFARQIARRNRVKVLVPVQLRHAIERRIWEPGLTFDYIDTRTYVPWEGAAEGRVLWPLASYCLFQIQAYARAKRLLRTEHFDVTQHLTIANYRFPSLLPFLPLPSVLGPLGGGEAVPRGLRTPSAYGAVRSLSLGLAHRDPVVRSMLRRAGRLLVANPETGRRLGSENRERLEVMTYGFDAAELPEPQWNREPGQHLRIVCASRLVRHKGVDLLIRAVPAIAAELGGRLEVVIYGEGPEARQLAKLARALGADRYVEIRGRVQRSTLLLAYRESDVFCFPSLRDTCPVALLEAMAAGLPVVVLDHSGPAQIVDEACGIRVLPTTLAGTVEGLVAAVCRLAKDPDLRVAMGQAARGRVLRDFRWDDRGDRLAAIYDALVGRSATGVGR